MPGPSDQPPTRPASGETPEHWHARPTGAVLASFGTDGARGLGDVEARRRLARDGPNELKGEPPVPAWRRFVAQFRSVLVLLLLAATAISLALWFAERDAALPYDALAILAIVVLNASLGFVQEARAEQADAEDRDLQVQHVRELVEKSSEVVRAMQTEGTFRTTSVNAIPRVEERARPRGALPPREIAVDAVGDAEDDPQRDRGPRRVVVRDQHQQRDREQQPRDRHRVGRSGQGRRTERRVGQRQLTPLPDRDRTPP